MIFGLPATRIPRAEVRVHQTKHATFARNNRDLYYGEAGIMTDAADDFDALFEEVAAQRASAQAPAAAPAPAPVARGDEWPLGSPQTPASRQVPAAVG